MTDPLAPLRERRRELARVTADEVADLGLSRADLTALALMPSEQVARMEAMARIHGCDPDRLAMDRDLQVAAALTCVSCGEQRRCRGAVEAGAFREETDFCPNTVAYRMLAAE